MERGESAQGVDQGSDLQNPQERQLVGVWQLKRSNIAALAIRVFSLIIINRIKPA